ncbi:MAG: hypothetical protein Q9220_000093 [cf. Caloplaca sp. 1 TL-2023]
MSSHMSVAHDTGFDALQILYYAIKDVEARIVEAGNSRLGGGQWSFAFNHGYTASALDTGGSQFLQVFRHLTWPVLRDGLKALNDFVNVTNLTHDVKGLHFGINMRALHNPNAANGTNPPESGDPNPAAHYFYFFENDPAVASFVASVFRGIAACADHHDCPNSIVFCDDKAWPGYCSRPVPGVYGFVTDPNQEVAALNNRPKGGGSMFVCPAGWALPRNPTPCSTPGGADTSAFALLMEAVQIDVITRPDEDFLAARTGSRIITMLEGISPGPDNVMGRPVSLKELGMGTNGGGLRTKGLANAQNYASFASWSWDLGFGTNPYYGDTCEGHFMDVVKSQQLQPIS